MTCRLTAVLSLVCLSSLVVVGCGPSSSNATPSLDGYLGSYTVDRDASLALSMPIWNEKVTRGTEKDIANLVAQPPVMVKKMRDDLATLLGRGEQVVGEYLRRVTLDLTVSKRRAFEFTTDISDLKEGGCSGLWTVENGELFLVRDTVDGEALVEKSSLRLAIDGEELHLRWPGLAYVFVLRKG
ncbi:MAG: hypothetical protein ACI9EF_000663 [Pseudohongiellaceae bacterium]|jgi:hypothetical protein